MTLTIDETNEVLKLAQRADKRTIGKADIEFWQVALRGLAYAECAAAMIEHYTRSTDFAMPKHIRDIVDDYRATQRRSSVPAAEDGNHCGRPSCVCDHKRCDHGWANDPSEYEGVGGGVLHCATCHPGRRQEPTENRKQWMARLQEQDAAWYRKQNRSAA